MRRSITLLERALLSMAALVLGVPASADTGVGVDLQLGNKLDPTGGVGFLDCDRRGASWFSALAHRTPTGNLYACPPAPPETRSAGAWLLSGEVGLGMLGLSGDKHNALFQRYTDWSNAFGIANVQLNAERPADGSYVDLRGSRISDDDQFYKLSLGQPSFRMATAAFPNRV